MYGENNNLSIPHIINIFNKKINQMSFLSKILESIFPFLFNALRRAWDSLTTDQQNAVVNSGLIGQFLKNNLTILGTDAVNELVKLTGLPADTVTSLLISLAGKLGLTTTDVNNAVSYIQGKLSGAASNEEWNGLLQIILQAGASILSGGAVDWVHLALGLAEWAYQKFIAHVDIPVITPAVAAA